MRDYLKPKTWLIVFLMFTASFILSSAIVFYEFGWQENIKTTQASADNNVSGWAWSANVGWVSFNCTDTANSCSGGSNNGQPCPNGNECVGGSCVNTCSALSNYGTSISTENGHFSGYAWNHNVGWISFNETGAPSYSFNSGCITAGSCAAANNCTACYNWSDHKVHGWAKILSLGDGGWIQFDGTKQDGQPWSPQVSIDPATDTFSGWAWNASNDGAGIGWISFNCSNDGSCSTADYKTIGKINRSPTVSNMSSSNWNFVNAGQYGALKANLIWQFNDADGNSERAYQVIVNTTNSADNPLFDSGICLGYNNPSDKCKVEAGVGQFPLHSALSLNYNTSYYWWVKVWDNALNSLSSALTQYNTAADTDNNDSAPLTFTTYKHEMPDVDFNRFPENPSRGEEVKFTDISQVYLSGAPSQAVPCDDAKCDWQWTATANVDIANPTASTTIMKFNSAGNATITFKVTDTDGYYISISKEIKVNAKLPKWKEVKPE